MLKFTDNQKIEHVFNLENLVHVHVRKSDEKNVTLTMHTLGPHTIPLTVDSETAEFVLSELGEHYAIEH
ncbi:hypothetical protein [Acinetobacter sp. TUM15064]|uniref:hypothetical protein n=1 Tax=Acinetobacter sp. TUM15064 TaxID=2609134 RepID=UPI00124E4E6E|nr:hypothetical protein [Acinetobacter sp. TUM15064]